jgi:RND family efflux transporter MFP subunit
VLGATGTAVIVVLVLWLMGVFHSKVAAEPPRRVLVESPAAATWTVQETESTLFESVVGTVEAVERIRVGSRILARVEKVHVRASQRVAPGEVMVELDDRDARAALAEARAALDAAVAANKQAELDLQRSSELLARNIESTDKVERDRTALRRAEAEVERFTEAASRAETALGFATIRAPSAGVVIDKHVEAGNLASPGEVVVTLYDPSRLQLVANVREALATRLRPGGKVRVRLESLDLSCDAEIARIVPEAQRQSRSFKVEVTGPCPPGVMSGMFARVLLPAGTRREILVPRAALQRSGQIDLAFVVQTDGTLLRRFVRIGRTPGDKVEILSGLAVGERILLDASAAVAR